jgi:hypothetical protein
MNDTPTPETDENTLQAIDIGFGGSFDAVHAQVSKQLERERDEARAALKTGGLLEIIDRAGHERAHAIRERDEMKEQCDLLTEQLDFQQKLSREYVDLNTGWRNKWECAVEMAALAEIERDEAREQRDTLAEALDRIADLCQMTCMSYETQSFRATEIAINALADINQLEP